ncbi:MAG: helix-turn-helix domain-containing protein [Dehalococcoidia bacterium]
MRKARMLRAQKRLSLRDVEREIGVDYTTISKFEHGALLREPALRAYAELLDATIDDLLAQDTNGASPKGA